MRQSDISKLKFILWATVPLSFLFTIGCINKPATDVPSTETPCTGMVKVASKGNTFNQGWNDPRASLDEKPGEVSTFTYNFCLDSTEITQKQFFELMKRQPVADTSSCGVGDCNPVYFVSWFDAALFCNARSRAESLDTVYVYSGKKTLVSGSVYELTGLYNDLSRNGYRLPTEAEWEYAARGASSSLPFSVSSDSASANSYAWYLGNAGATTHPVATKLPNSLGLYDMAGNVFEWTNDWKGSYDSMPVVDPLGAAQPGKEFEKVIKGGSFNYDVAYLRPTRRSATYPAIPSSSCEYIGFRCARSAIQHGQYLGIRHTDFTPNPVLLLAGSPFIRSFLNSLEAKLVFVNVMNDRRTLCAIDFSDNFSYVRQFVDDTDVYAPVISPDGHYVAYCNRNVGLSGPAKITIRTFDSLSSPRARIPVDSAYCPQWWIDPVSGDTCSIFTNSSMVNSNDLWQSTKTFKQKIKGGIPVDLPIEIIGEGSYHDGISRDNRFALTSWPRLLARDLAIGQQRQLFQPLYNGKDASGSTQVCNASISPDSGNAVRCLFLDFGYPKTSSITGCSYGIHQFLFVATLQDSIMRSIRVPTDEGSWDNPKWSNRSDYAVSCIRGGSDQAYAIYLINLEKIRSERIIEGIELQQPSLWTGAIISNQSGFALDSIGRYGDPLNSTYQAQLGGKLFLFWQQCDVLEVAIIGSSQAIHGIDPKGISGFKCFNFSAAGGDLLGQKKIVLNYLLPHCPRLKMICSSLDACWLNTVDGDFSWKNGIGQSLGYTYDSIHDFWKDGVSQDFKDLMRAIPTPYLWDTLDLGFCPSACNGWGDSIAPCIDNNAWTIDDIPAKRNIETIVAMADSLRQRGVHWIVIDFPISPHYKNTPYYSLRGPLWKTALDIQKKLSELEQANPYFHFYNANMNGNHDYADNEAQDENHLCTMGSKKFTVRVDSLITAIIHEQK
jgi:uncharacterized protein (TIGR02171 family)